VAIEKQIEIKFVISPNKEIDLISAPGVFTPNATTNLLIQAVRSTVSGSVSLLDLGCGTGVVGLSLYLQKIIKLPLYASDLSELAVLCSRMNFERYGCLAEVRRGSLFEPWLDDKFDVIIDDISGIAQGVAEVSPWFQGVPCDTGKDGIDLVVNVLRSASQHLKKKGVSFFQCCHCQMLICFCG
jgi:SAM-dependent methyltransferase